MNRLLIHPDPRLLRPSTNASMKEARRLIKALWRMIFIVEWGTPVGMAAPQIGVNKRVFLALGTAYINPTIHKYHGTPTLEEESCYSLGPEEVHTVPRYPKIDLSWQDERGYRHRTKVAGFRAQVIQHEYDHLEGILCNNRKHDTL